MVRDAIHSSDTGRQIGYIENKQAFNLKGTTSMGSTSSILEQRRWLATYLGRVARIREPPTIFLPLRITNNKDHLVIIPQTRTRRRGARRCSS